GDGCTDLKKPIEETASQEVRFGAAEQVTLLLEGQAVACTGPMDCKEPLCDGKACGAGGSCHNGACTGASSEVDCTDGVDNDNDQKVDCADTADCLNLSCTPLDPCTTGTTCNAAGACAGGGPKQCNTPPGPCYLDAGACIAGDGGCQYTPTPNKPCASGNKCRQNEICDAVGNCGGGTGIVCSS